MPWRDWQFWLVTLLVLLAAAWLFRAILPIPYLSRRHRLRKQQRRVPLTIRGRSVK